MTSQKNIKFLQHLILSKYVNFPWFGSKSVFKISLGRWSYAKTDVWFVDYDYNFFIKLLNEINIFIEKRSDFKNLL